MDKAKILNEVLKEGGRELPMVGKSFSNAFSDAWKK